MAVYQRKRGRNACLLFETQQLYVKAIVQKLESPPYISGEPTLSLGLRPLLANRARLAQVYATVAACKTGSV